MQECDEHPCLRQVGAWSGLWCSGRPLTLRPGDVVVFVDRLGVEPERRQDERQAEIEKKRVDAPQNMQRERDS